MSKTLPMGIGIMKDASSEAHQEVFRAKTKEMEDGMLYAYEYQFWSTGRPF